MTFYQNVLQGRCRWPEQAYSGREHTTCYCHPIVICCLTKLFNLFLSLAHTPDSFGKSYSVPIPIRDGHARTMSVDDFRGSIISKVFELAELAILNKFSKYFTTLDHQFRFKKRISCRHAIYCVRNVIEGAINNGSTVNMCALDFSKAFDRMNRYV